MISFYFPEFVLKKCAQNYSEHHLQAELSQLNETLNKNDVGFFWDKDFEKNLIHCQEIYEKFKHKKYFFQVGIGGSSLGAEMLTQALSSDKTQIKFSFINNIDPDALHEQISSLFGPLSHLDINDAIFYFVSKSGATAETLATFSIISGLLKSHGISDDQLKSFFVFATDPQHGDLRQIGKDLKIITLDIPSNIGGRFSALTPVGIFPALFINKEVKNFLKYRENIQKFLLENFSPKNPVFLLAHLLFEYKKNYQVNQTVLMPYSSKLNKFSSWFVQLWAESLGKKEGLNQKEIYTGLTPIMSYGATDQHSQMQLFKDGPWDKFIIFIEVENFHQNYQLANSFDYPSLKKLSPYSLSQLMEAEFKGTLRALEEDKRPFVSLKIPNINWETLIELVLFFETLTVLMGQHLNLDPFNQPGVEAGKKYAFEFLAKLTPSP